EDLVAVVGHQHRVLPLRREAVVLRDDGPAVGELPDRWLARVDHRLDGESHARLQAHAGARAPIVQHLRLLVEFPADAVAAELAHHAVAVSLGVLLYRGADVAEKSAGADRPDAEPHAFVGRLAKALRLDRGLAHVKHAARVAVKAVLDHGY